VGPHPIEDLVERDDPFLVTPQAAIRERDHHHRFGLETRIYGAQSSERAGEEQCTDE
jgi:hypothetical protein